VNTKGQPKYINLSLVLALALNSKSAMSGVVDGALIAAFWYSQHHDISMKYMRDKIAAVMSNEEMQARTLPSLMKSRSAWARNARRFPPIVVIQAFRGDNRTTDGPWRSSWYVVIGSSKTRNVGERERWCQFVVPLWCQFVAPFMVPSHS